MQGKGKDMNGIRVLKDDFNALVVEFDGDYDDKLSGDKLRLQFEVWELKSIINILQFVVDMKIEGYCNYSHYMDSGVLDVVFTTKADEESFEEKFLKFLEIFNFEREVDKEFTHQVYSLLIYYPESWEVYL